MTALAHTWSDALRLCRACRTAAADFTYFTPPAEEGPRPRGAELCKYCAATGEAIVEMDALRPLLAAHVDDARIIATVKETYLAGLIRNPGGTAAWLGWLSVNIDALAGDRGALAAAARGERPRVSCAELESGEVG